MTKNKYLNLFAEIADWSDEGIDTNVTVNLANVGYKDVISLMAAVYVHIGRNLEINPLEMINDTSAAIKNIEEILKDDYIK